jgi:hypothetical protein
MKSLILISTVLVVSGLVHAAEKTVHQFSCKTDTPVEGNDPKFPTRPIKPTEFSFAVENLKSNKPGYWTLNDNDEPVTMKPTDSILDLNDNWQILGGSKGLELNSDGDGFQFTTVMLFKDKGYKKGYVRVVIADPPDHSEDKYSTVTCKVELKK